LVEKENIAMAFATDQERTGTNIDFDETRDTMQQIGGMKLLRSISAEALERGPISDAEIDEEIRAARAELAAHE
jgi:hypothetical protein